VEGGAALGLPAHQPGADILEVGLFELRRVGGEDSIDYIRYRRIDIEGMDWLKRVALE